MLSKIFKKKSIEKQVVRQEVVDQVEQRPPFFILGCVRSGTTMLRHMLRLHPALESPEETHFFRWSDPFKTPRYLHPYNNNQDIKKQQAMDGIDKAAFDGLLAQSDSRSDLSMRYADAYLQHIGNPNARWFDKTPQNIYGILLISAQIPDAKFIHIYRNPLNVVASLFEGKIMAIDDLFGAMNYWKEAMQIMEEYKKHNAHRVLEVAYESITEEPAAELDKILTFLGEENSISLPDNFVHRERNRYRKVLSRKQIQQVIDFCSPYYERYGYEVDV